MADGDNKRIFKELRTRYTGGWSPPTTEYPNEKFVKPGTDSKTPAIIWARFLVVIASERAMDIGDSVKTFRVIGQLVVQLFAPLGSGTMEIRGKADDLAVVFRNWCGETVRCREATINDIGDDRNGWYQINVTISFQSDSLH